MVKPKGSLLVLAVTLNTALVASAKKIPIGIPEKSWGVVGYESFHGQRASVPRTATSTERKRTAREVAKVPPPSPPPPPKVPAKKIEPSKTASEDETSGVTKSIFGIGLAVASAALGGSILASQQPKPERSLIEAFQKPVAMKPMVVKNPKKLKIEPKGASITSEVFNLVKAIVGVGVLSLPAGVAAYGSAPSAFVPAALLITLIGVLSGYGFSLIGKVCSYTGARSYREAWSLSVGEESSWMPAWFGTLKTFLACLAFSMVLGDTFSSLLETDRNKTLLSVTVLILAPLCLKKELKSLAPYSFVGVLGMIYTACAMSARWLDGSYTGDGALVGELARHLKPKFGEIGMKGVLSSNSLILVCMLSTAYMAHFNAPKFYTELHNNTVERFNSVVSWGFGVSIFLMGFITFVGFNTFGKACDGLVLNNYAGSDYLMGISRISVSLSLLFSYPLAFTACREGFLDLAKVPIERRSAGIMNFVTISLLAGITYLATSLTDVSFVLAFGGAMLGNALTYVFPAMMYRAIVKKKKLKGQDLSVFVAMISALLGIFMGTIGAGMALKSLD